MRKAPRLLPCRGGSLVIAGAIERSEIGDYFVIALSMDDLPKGRTEPVLAEYTHCATQTQAIKAMRRYWKMREVFSTFVLYHLPNLNANPEGLRKYMEARKRKESGAKSSGSTKQARSK